MADLLTRAGAPDERWHDETDGTFARGTASHLRAWDANQGTWVRVPVDANGYLVVTPRPSVALSNAAIDTAISGDNTIVAGDTTKKIKVVAYTIVVSAALAVRWKSGSTNKSGAMDFAANGGIAIAGNVDSPVFETAVNSALILNLGGAVQASGHVCYFLEA